MNYYNPYLYSMPMMKNASKVGLFSRLFKGSGVTFSGVLSGTQKVLNIANQAIPLVKQVRPMVGNAKTMFKIMNEFKRNDNKKNNNVNFSVPATSQSSNNLNKEISTTNIDNNSLENKENKTQTYDNGLTFFV